MYNKVNCPYCSKEVEFDACDGKGREEDETYQQQCSHCDKYFTFMQKHKKKWRRINPYTCKDCGKRRLAFNHSRAKNQLCTICEKQKANENQLSLFPEYCDKGKEVVQ